MRLMVYSRRPVADGILELELVPSRGALPDFAPGAHIDLQLANGLVRSYSLLNAPGVRDRYVIAVSRDTSGAGGSTFIHDALHVGAALEASEPRNLFPLVDAAHVVFIAGGIGITPIWSMVQYCEAQQRSWQLFYAARTRARCAYLAALLALEQRSAGRLHLHIDDEHGGATIDVAAAVAAAPADAHLYCCGPTPMLEAFGRVSAARPRQTVHVEYFTPKEPPATRGGFTVVLARSGRSFHVKPGQSILDVLLDAGFNLPFACRQGTCGACQTDVLDGTPDHRDVVLSDEEKNANKAMMLCCSGSKSDTLVLDL